MPSYIDSDYDSDSDYEEPTSSDISMGDLSGDISMEAMEPGELEGLKADMQTNLDSVYTNLPADPLILTSENVREWKDVHLVTQGSRVLLMARWIGILNGFFNSALPENVSDFTTRV